MYIGNYTWEQSFLKKNTITLFFIILAIYIVLMKNYRKACTLTLKDRKNKINTRHFLLLFICLSPLCLWLCRSVYLCIVNLCFFLAQGSSSSAVYK